MRICVINTGGTIASIGEPLAPMPAAQFVRATRDLLGATLAAAMPQARIHFDLDLRFDSPSGMLDSTNLRPAEWCAMAGRILDLYADFDAFVILHGTDTMDFTGAALSLLLNPCDGSGQPRALLSKPVILTGAQLPLFRDGGDGLALNARSDGYANLCGALQAASLGIPEVALFFDGKLLRANRSLKISSQDFAAFDTAQMPPLARAGIAIRREAQALPCPPAALSLDDPHRRDGALRQLRAIANALPDHPVVELPVVPLDRAGLLAGLIDDLVARGVKGIVLDGYGEGNVPADGGLTAEAIRRADAAGVMIVIGSRVTGAAVGDFHYAAGAWIAATGAVAGGDTTSVALVAKTAILLAAAAHHGWDRATLKRLMTLSLVGERG